MDEKLTKLGHLRAAAAAAKELTAQVAGAAAEAIEEADRKTLPAGGTTGQILAKSSEENYAAEWIDPPKGSGAASSGAVPVGAIVIWSGAADNIPAGWALCDGREGRPDLRGRFVLGAGGAYSTGAAGGEERHTLTVNEMPSHRHQAAPASSGNTEKSNGYAYFKNGTVGWYANREFYFVDENDYTQADSGGSASHNNMPPYYALCYIIKVAEE